MYPIIVFGLLSVTTCMGDPVLESLYGIHGVNKVRVCLHLEDVKVCDGAIWMQDWVVVQENCIRREETAPISVWKEIVNCTEAMKGKIKGTSHNVVSRYYQDLHPTNDLALLHLDWPFFITDPLDNRSANSALIRKLTVWVESINEHTPRNPHLTGVQLYYNKRYLTMYYSPIKMFLVSVILPSTAFILFFLFVIFCTGSSKNKIPYKNLIEEKEDTAHV